MFPLVTVPSSRYPTTRPPQLMSHLRHSSHPQRSAPGHCVHTHLLGALAFFPLHVCPGPSLLSGRRVSRGTPIRVPFIAPPHALLPIHYHLSSLGNSGLQSKLHSKALTSVGQSSQMVLPHCYLSDFPTSLMSLPLTSLQTFGKMPGAQ